MPSDFESHPHRQNMPAEPGARAAWEPASLNLHRRVFVFALEAIQLGFDRFVLQSFTGSGVRSFHSSGVAFLPPAIAVALLASSTVSAWP